MSQKIFEQQPFGKVALQKLGNVPDNFRLYNAEWIGHKNECRVMRVTGAEFRFAKKGAKKGTLSVMVPNTKRTVYVTAEEMNNIINKLFLL